MKSSAAKRTVPPRPLASDTAPGFVQPNPQAIARKVWYANLELKNSEADLKKLKDELIATGGTGVTYENINMSGGKVQVTKPSNGGPTGKFSYQFDAVIFAAMPPEKRKELIDMGVVTQVAEVTRGTAAQVKVLGQK